MNFEKILNLFSKPSSWKSTTDELPKHSGWYQIIAVYSGFYFIQISFYFSSIEKFVSNEFNAVKIDSDVEVRSWRECRRSRFKNLCHGFQGGLND